MENWVKSKRSELSTSIKAIGSGGNINKIFAMSDIRKKNEIEFNMIKDVIDMPSMAEGKKNKRQINGNQLFNEIEQRINQQARVYLPYVSIQSVQFLSENSDFDQMQLAPSSLANYMYLSIRYTILSANIQDTLTLQI